MKVKETFARIDGLLCSSVIAVAQARRVFY